MVIDPMDEDRSHIPNAVREGMRVIAADGQELGNVSEVIGEGFRISRTLRSDLEIPFDAIRIVNDDGILLAVEESDIGDFGAPDGEPYTRPPHLS